MNPIRGRGTGENPANRFDQILIEPDMDALEDRRRALEPLASPKTKFYRDQSKSIISYNESPDLSFDASINPYRGCEHGCAYCYARPTHEYLGLSAGLDFETQIFIKENAPELLEKELSAKKWKPQLLAISGVSDCYQPIEKTLRITRRCLEVLARFRNPVVIVTKNHLATRDIDILQEVANQNCASVFISLSTLNNNLAAKMEPRTSRPNRRLQAIQELSAAGIPTGILAAPIVPGLNDHEIPNVLQAAKEAGASHAKYILLRMPHGIKELFADFLEQHYPTHKEKVLNRIKHTRDGKLNSNNFGERFRGQGIFAEQIEKMFETTCHRMGLNKRNPKIETRHFQIPAELLPPPKPTQEMLWG